MDFPNFNTNIEMEDVLQQLRAEQERKAMKSTNERSFDPKKYLGVMLPKDVESKQLIIRLLPFTKDGGTPFHKVHMHTVKVNTEVSKSGWKTITCASKNTEVPGEKHACPFCETAIAARQMAKKTLNDVERKKFNDIAFANSSTEMWIVRCIERGHEEDGVKFWLFPNPKSGGIFQTIMNIYATRKESGERKGEVRNIFDLNHGKDLIVTIKRGADGKRKVDIVDDEDFTPLTTDLEQGNAWINDSTNWYDLYPIKREDYMAVLVEGGVPYYDKSTNSYVDKETYLDKAESAKQERELQQKANEVNCPIDYTVPKPTEEASVFGKLPQNQVMGEPIKAIIPHEVPKQPQPSGFQVKSDITADEMPPQPNWEDELPF